jgi:hypothetical protein
VNSRTAGIDGSAAPFNMAWQLDTVMVAASSSNPRRRSGSRAIVTSDVYVDVDGTSKSYL